MNLLDLMVKIGVDDQASSRIAGIADGAKGVAGGVAAAGAAIAGAAAAAGAGVAAIGKQALDSYASYEQLSGGVEKLFGDASDAVARNAQEAYKTTGMSANQYMEQATSFSAALIGSLGGDTAKAAEQADVAMRAMSDNVNVFGSNMGDVQNAFQGFAKQNYTMLDNLKLGYGGTKEEMQRLIDDANEWGAANGKASDLSIDSFSDVVTAIQQIQEKQGIAGTTAKEAATTIEGSINMTKAAWQNLLTEFGKEDGDVGARLGELVESAKTALLGHLDEATGEVKGGIIPRFQEIFSSIAEVLPEIVPQMIEMGKQVFGALADAVAEVAPTILEALVTALDELATFMAENSEGMAEGAIQFFLAIVDALAEIAPSVMEALTALVVALVEKLIEHAPDILAAAGELVLGLVEGFANGLVPMMGAAEEVVNGALEAVGEFFMGMFEAGAELVSNIAGGIADAARSVWDAVTGAIQDAVDGIGEFFSRMFDAGVDLINGLVQGLTNAPTIVLDTLVGMAQGAVDGFLGFFGIASPSKRMRGYGRNIMDGLALGIADRSADVEAAMLGISDMLGSVPMTVGMASPLALQAAAPAGFHSGDVYNIYVTSREGEDVAVRIRNELHAYNLTRGR